MSRLLAVLLATLALAAPAAAGERVNCSDGTFSVLMPSGWSYNTGTAPAQTDNKPGWDHGVLNWWPADRKRVGDATIYNTNHTWLEWGQTPEGQAAGMAAESRVTASGRRLLKNGLKVWYFTKTPPTGHSVAYVFFAVKGIPYMAASDTTNEMTAAELMSLIETLGPPAAPAKKPAPATPATAVPAAPDDKKPIPLLR